MMGGESLICVVFCGLWSFFLHSKKEEGDLQARWWFLKNFLFTAKLGEDETILTSILFKLGLVSTQQLVWVHQLKSWRFFRWKNRGLLVLKAFASTCLEDGIPASERRDLVATSEKIPPHWLLDVVISVDQVDRFDHWKFYQRVCRLDFWDGGNFFHTWNHWGLPIAQHFRNIGEAIVKMVIQLSPTCFCVFFLEYHLLQNEGPTWISTQRKENLKAQRTFLLMHPWGDWNHSWEAFGKTPQKQDFF